MLETTDFFQEQIKQCLSRAAQSPNKGDREFWAKMANRWEALLQARQPRYVATEAVQKFRSQRLRLNDGASLSAKCSMSAAPTILNNPALAALLLSILKAR
jgi:hypothetical protein